MSLLSIATFSVMSAVRGFGKNSNNKNVMTRDCMGDGK